ncbi:Aste57867_232 [Aphanomyces stellatus]|uniref:Non-structural maintenance of chromosomes element 1 homolog n=1 Tax=Aphanomyces stellatus TaxID=120398 RepID=A0A485K719_9STRA|nr:hypothetical protein As57867_000232 [Aphanomyces stellatus]VFT77458.1 Aste57867_232 [Aphanomyces stellatus]
MVDKEFKQLCQEVYDTQEMSQHDLDEQREIIAKEIRPFSLDIKQCMYDDGHMYIGVVNTSNDEQAKMGNQYQPWEIVFFRKAIEHIVGDDDGEIEMATLLNLREGNSVHQVRSLVTRLRQEKWLGASILNDEVFSLGPRVFLELSVFIRELGVHECTICHSDVLQGVRCKTGDCATRVHEFCLKEHEANGRAYKCGACRTPLR